MMMMMMMTMMIMMKPMSQVYQSVLCSKANHQVFKILKNFLNQV